MNERVNRALPGVCAEFLDSFEIKGNRGRGKVYVPAALCRVAGVHYPHRPAGLSLRGQDCVFL